VLLHELFLGLPLFLEPCGFHTRAALQGSGSLFLNVWPIELNLRHRIDVFLVCLFPEFFIRDDSRPPNSTDVSVSPINERLQFSLNVSADQPCLTPL
jgi:hypothetical protein